MALFRAAPTLIALLSRTATRLLQREKDVGGLGTAHGLFPAHAVVWASTKTAVEVRGLATHDNARRDISIAGGVVAGLVPFATRGFRLRAERTIRTASRRREVDFHRRRVARVRTTWRRHVLRTSWALRLLAEG